MKKVKALSLLVLAVVTALSLCVFAACGETGGTTHTHSYGAWTITTEPTETAGGVATRTCTEDDYTETIDVPALSDDTVWTVSVVAATHKTEGKKIYTSVYGVVEIATAKLAEHEYGEWTITVQPTLTDGGKAQKSCTAGDDTQTVDIPALSDGSVWSVVEHDDAAHGVQGKTVYSSVYGTVTLTEEALEHEWTYQITVEPTLTESGKATASCECGEETEIDIPALSDGEVWSLTDSVAPTHSTDGTDTYSSVYGTVEITVEALGHNYEWVITVEPTKDAAGKAKQVCDCGEEGAETEETEIPALSDSAVWTEETIPADFTHGTTHVYTSVYGEVTIVDDDIITAPFYGKTYVPVELDASETSKLNRSVSPYVRSTALLAIDENGDATCESYPFRGSFHVSVIDAAAGKIGIEKDSSGSNNYIGFMDYETGFIVITRENVSTFNFANFLTPYGVPALSQIVSSAWGTPTDYNIAFTFTYTEEETEKSITVLIHNESVYFGVSLTTLSGDAVAANQAYNSDTLIIKKGDEQLFAFGMDADSGMLVELDGLEGVYSLDGEAELTLSGHGTLTLGQYSGTYEVLDEHKIGAYVQMDETTVYMEIELDVAAKTYSAVTPTVEITFDMSGHGTAIDPVQVNAKVAYALPVPEDETYLFRGWYLDQTLETPVGDEFIPTADVTLYAKWEIKVTISVYVDDDTVITLYASAGDVIGDVLAGVIENEIDEENSRMFLGWFLNAERDQELSLENQIPAELTELSVYAKWQNIPVYYGTYHGTEIYYSGSGGYANYTITIDAYGNITGNKTGTIVNYDKTKQLITWQTSSNQINYFFYDENSGVLAYNYNGSTNMFIGYDLNVLSKYQTDNNLAAFYGVNAPANHEGGTDERQYAQFVNIASKNGQIDVFIYDTVIYSDIIITNAFGEPLAVADIKNSKTVMVKTSDGTKIFARASIGDSFYSNSTTVALDEYLGSYTAADQATLSLDGTGNLTLGEYVGTYTVADESAGYQLDAFVQEGDTTVYYEVTINKDEMTYSLNKAMVTVTFDTNELDGNFTSLEVNKNVEMKIEPASAEGKLFRGWFEDQAFETALSVDDDGNYLFTPTDNATLYAKFIEQVTVTVVYNDQATENLVISDYGVGEVLSIPRPSYAGHKFLGWFTDNETFENEWGTQLEGGATECELSADVTIYAKWGEAPAYSGSYWGFNYDGENSDGRVENGDVPTATIEIDPEGAVPVTSNPWPFTQAMQLASYDEGTGAMSFTRGTSTHRAVRAANGVIVFEARGTTYGDIFVLVPVSLIEDKETAAIGSYWKDGTIRAISLTIGGENFNIFIKDGVVHFDAQFKSEKENGVDVAANEAYHTEKLYVYGSDGGLIGSFGYNGTTMVTLDGYEGTYSLSGDDAGFGETITLNGVSTIDTATLGESTYKLVEGDGYNAEVYIDGGYYRLNLDNSAMTYTIEKPMVTITFSSTYGNLAESSITVNMNIGIDLPSDLTDEDYLFRGWFVDDGFATAVTLEDGKYVPTESATLYAKWIKIYTVTAVWGNGYEENKVYKVGEGEYAQVEEPPFTNDLAFEGWYRTYDEAAGTYDNEWTDNMPIVADITIYAKWISAHAMYGGYTGMNVYGTPHQAMGSSNISIAADGTVSGSKSGEIAYYDEASGRFAISGSSSGTYYYGAFDAANGIMYYNYSSTSGVTDVAGQFELKNDVYVLIRTSISSTFSVTSGTAGGYSINGGLTRLFEATLNDGSKMNVFIHDGRIYGNVTVSGTSTDGTELTAVNGLTSIATEVTITDSKGTAIVTFVREGGDLVPKAEETESSVITYTGNVSFTSGAGFLSREVVISQIIVDFEAKTVAYTATVSGNASEDTADFDETAQRYCPDGYDTYRYFDISTNPGTITFGIAWNDADKSTVAICNSDDEVIDTMTRA